MSIIVGGVDIGSTTAKCVILDEEKKVLGKSLAPVGVKIVEDAEKAFNSALTDAGLKKEDCSFVVGTGYGRFKVYFGQAVITEISCHAKGAQFLFPETRTVLDIGGQDTKAIRINEKGSVVDFAMNDKCSAGTGRFLEVCAEALGYHVNEIGDLSLAASRPVKISSTCTVFAESEVINQVSRGKKAEDILAGMH
ncbi:MAG TPA: acyl-CoA dehydratase activase, partial [Candidatus Hodarchaeales archaeon]|nr:acyl-CoA dehydratase activase [Candidatus Hodarchaeales archaeon]